MYGCVSPSLIKEPTSVIQMLEIVFINFASPKIHARNFKITPEVAGWVSIGLLIMPWPPGVVFQPFSSVVRVLIFWVGSQKFHRLWPEGLDAFWGVVQVYGEAVCFVVVFHVAENIVVYVAEEVDFGLHAPVVFCMGEGGVFVEEAGVPTAHLMVRNEISVLNTFLFEDLSGFRKEVIVDPWGDCPVFLRYQLWRGPHVSICGIEDFRVVIP